MKLRPIHPQPGPLKCVTCGGVARVLLADDKAYCGLCLPPWSGYVMVDDDPSEAWKR